VTKHILNQALLKNSPAQRSLARRNLLEFLTVRGAEPSPCWQAVCAKQSRSGFAPHSVLREILRTSCGERELKQIPLPELHKFLACGVKVWYY
jgi:hypothetical protein